MHVSPLFLSLQLFSELDGVKMKTKLNIATYLVPSISIEFFQAVMVYLERKLKCHTTLRYESRWEGPPKERADIFDDDGVDLGKFQRG